MSFYCYIVECADGSYYTGWTTDPHRRVKQHNGGRGAKYTRQHGPVVLVYLEPQPDRSTAQRRERRIKALSREQKHRLVIAYRVEIETAPPGSPGGAEQRRDRNLVGKDRKVAE